MAERPIAIHTQKHLGEPITVGDLTVTPQSQALIVRWPRGGLVWNQPAAVLVERGARAERLSIHDVTRIVRWALFGLSVVFSLIVLASYLKGKGREQ